LYTNYFHKILLLRFFLGTLATNAITMTIRQQYTKPWPIWGSLTSEEKERFFQHFKVSFLLFKTITDNCYIVDVF